MVREDRSTFQRNQSRAKGQASTRDIITAAIINIKRMSKFFILQIILKQWTSDMCHYTEMQLIRSGKPYITETACPTFSDVMKGRNVTRSGIKLT